MALWSLKGQKILIIDDFPEMRSVLRSLLLPLGADSIATADNGEDAIEAITNTSFDIVLCDYNLGDGKDGQQVLEEVKLRKALRYTSIFIMVTAENTTFMVMGALEHQPDDYLSKPVTRTVLQARLKKLMEKKGALSDLGQAIDQENNLSAIKLCDHHISNEAKYRSELTKLKCDLMLNEGLYEDAEALCQQVLAERDTPWATFALGKINYEQQNYEQASQLFEQVIDSNNAFIAAYDWLAKAQLKRQDHQAAQNTLLNAVDCSPKSVQRQRNLAEVSETNQDFETAERARKKAVKLGKNSIQAQAQDYTGLAKILTKNNNPREALRTIELIKNQFKDDGQAKLMAALTKSDIYLQTGQTAKSKEAADEAIALYSQNPDAVDAEISLELIKTCLDHGNTDNANNITGHLVHNNHEDQALSNQLNQIYLDAGIDDISNNIINSARKEMQNINNQGASLLNAGKIEDSINYFEKALQRAPLNPVLNMNAAHAHLLLAKKSTTTELLEKIHRHLELCQHDTSLHERYQILDKAYQQLVRTHN